jgi:hypothetical protein
MTSPILNTQVFCDWNCTCLYLYLYHWHLYLVLITQGYDGIDLEMNFNGSKSGLQDDGFDDVVCYLL